MNPLDRIHGSCVHPRRVRVLADHLARLLPPGVSVLDIGAGDGQLSRRVLNLRPDLSIQGIDTLLRPQPAIPTRVFDGLHAPFPDAAFDLALLVDVLHHASDPFALLREATRVSRRHIVIKDHARTGLLADFTLRFMDRVGNARHGVSLPCNYWSPPQWEQAFDALHLHPLHRMSRLHLYPFPASLLFDRSLHFLAMLEKAGKTAQAIAPADRH